MRWVRHVVLLHFTDPPTSDVEEFVVHREVDVRYERSNGFERLQDWGQGVLVGRFRRDGDDLFGLPRVTVPVPPEDGSRQVLCRDDDSDKLQKSQNTYGFL